MKQLKFPSYEWLKALPLERTIIVKDIYRKPFKRKEDCEYEFTIFDTPVSTYGQLSYNEDGSGCICFDVIEDVYIGKNRLGLSLKFNKANYQKICEHAQEVYDEFFKELEKDMSYQWDCTPEEYFENEY